MRVLSVIVLAMLLFGCGAGNYNGRFATISPSQLVPNRMLMQLTQSGSSVSGSISFDGTPAGQFTGGTFFGTLNGDTLSAFTLNMSGGSGACSITGSGTYANMYLNLNIASLGTCGGGAQGATTLVLGKFQ